jgi:hypothetical protein
MTAAPPLWRLAARSLFLWVGLLLTLIGVVFLAIGAALAWDEQAFASQGETRTASVVERSIIKADFERNPATRYRVRYRFAGAKGTMVEQTRDVAVEEWERLAPGSGMQVRVLPDGVSRPPDASDWAGAMAFSALGLIMAGAGVPLMFVGLREMLRQRRVWRSGLRVPAVVTGIAPSSTSVNGVRQWEIRYAYTDPSGVRHRARSDWMTEDEARRWREGDRGFALVDPKSATSSVWAGADGAST